MKVLLFGHSFARRTGEYLTTRPYLGQALPGFRLENCGVIVRAHGVGGATIHKGIAMNGRPYKNIQGHLDTIHTRKPDIVLLQLGSNDLAIADVNPEILAGYIVGICHFIQFLEVNHIVVGQLLKRTSFYPLVPNYNEKTSGKTDRNGGYLLLETPGPPFKH